MGWYSTSLQLLQPSPSALPSQCSCPQLVLLLPPPYSQVKWVNPAFPQHGKKISSVNRRSAPNMMSQSKQHVQEHWMFNDKSSDLQQWLTVAKQKLEAFQDASEGCKTNNRALDLERLQAEFPDRENQLQFMEARAEVVAANSSSEGAAKVRAEVKSLAEAFESLENMMSWLLQKIHPNRTTPDAGKKVIISDNMPILKVLNFGFSPLCLFLSSLPSPTPLIQKNMTKREDSNDLQLIRNFEKWLQGENAKLSQILAVKPSSHEDLKARQKMLKELQLRVPEGQQHFEDLLGLRPIVKSSEELEELRYRWMLYKSKLNDSSNLLMTSSFEETAMFRKGKPSGTCSFLRRVCWAALPLQLLLLFLLLLAFLLPLVEETHSCKLANNFARSFNLMLRYQGPPPT
ncbi:hypothetical protein JRQ81_001097 [Phrynocephalus forsythii]|uniref:KASH domain-containing protein n=1 Tax=Phrynocephalus forsythii TaxID=171643 RepID=A0A9Q0Y7N6_9SAUR|nr:hypothetical protein JRQ81_001097 [Phrynocephalus forsythii]